MVMPDDDDSDDDESDCYDDVDEKVNSYPSPD